VSLLRRIGIGGAELGGGLIVAATSIATPSLGRLVSLQTQAVDEAAPFLLVLRQLDAIAELAVALQEALALLVVQLLAMAHLVLPLLALKEPLLGLETPSFVLEALQILLQSA